MRGLGNYSNMSAYLVGVALTEEEKAKVEADTEEEINALFEQFKEQAKEEIWD